MDNANAGGLLPSHTEALNALYERARLASLSEYESENTKIDDATLLRFLRSTNFDVNRAFENLSFCLKWRKEFQDVGVEQITESSCLNELRKEYAFTYKKDKLGHPVIYARAGRYNRADRDVNELLRFGMLLFENTVKCLEPPEEKICVVIDETGFGMHALDVEVLKVGAPILDRCYPERISNMIFINAPTVFSTVWNVITPFIAEHTRTKIRFISNPKELFELIDENDVPIEFGGKDPFVYDCYKHGLVGVPPGQAGERTVSKELEFSKDNVTVPAGGKFEHTVDIGIDHKNKTLCWEFKTEGKDIAFCVLLRGNGKDKPVVESRRYESHINRVKNNALIEEFGTYVLQWDNSYSYWTSKTMSFKCFVTETPLITT